jgi:hypothetical protein
MIHTFLKSFFINPPFFCISLALPCPAPPCPALPGPAGPSRESIMIPLHLQIFPIIFASLMQYNSIFLSPAMSDIIQQTTRFVKYFFVFNSFIFYHEKSIAFHIRLAASFSSAAFCSLNSSSLILFFHRYSYLTLYNNCISSR